MALSFNVNFGVVGDADDDAGGGADVGGDSVDGGNNSNGGCG